eukprot:CAMPEP_0182427718 /NCGR_PEP_ID=MMETSP1167-20130531/18983_1 /TAXON_ID=2988 /ORGANISM="Mallomonas Sp, Strain CCMP3275" /LENGTH=463 /DNA_ID=CAMNT_0024610157 /DNA_START=92 /DNA_END=1483 /DNA_ORIENTATION=-
MSKTFDLIVIGGGSGGIASAKRAAGYGAKVALIEGARYGGTCVNVGCVPKKVMFNASQVNEFIHEAHHFGFNVGDVSFDWTKIKKSRDRYIERLNGIYESGLDKLQITRISGMAQFSSSNSVTVAGEEYAADHIVIAVGGKPSSLGVEGEEYVGNSDDFFVLEKQPMKAAVLGAGYIAVEMSGLLHGLGTATSLFVRGAHALRTFDSMISSHLDECMRKSGVHIEGGCELEKVEKETDNTYTLYMKNGTVFTGYDFIMSAIGREPNTKLLKLEEIGVNMNKKGQILVDEYQNTSLSGVYALGDVCGEVELTPMAIAAGRRLADRLFGNMPQAKADYTFVPTVVFSHPPIGTIGLTEKGAREKYGDDIKIYNSTFVNLWYGPFFNGEPGEKPLTKYKLICTGERERVVGLHAIGMASDEILQGFGVAMKMGATKADFDACVAIHPTAGEEMVTMAPWGMSGSKL